MKYFNLIYTNVTHLLGYKYQILKTLCIVSIFTALYIFISKNPLFTELSKEFFTGITIYLILAVYGSLVFVLTNKQHKLFIIYSTVSILFTINIIFTVYLYINIIFYFNKDIASFSYIFIMLFILNTFICLAILHYLLKKLACIPLSKEYIQIFLIKFLVIIIIIYPIRIFINIYLPYFFNFVFLPIIIFSYIFITYVLISQIKKDKKTIWDILNTSKIDSFMYIYTWLYLIPLFLGLTYIFFNSFDIDIGNMDVRNHYMKEILMFIYSNFLNEGIFKHKIGIAHYCSLSPGERPGIYNTTDQVIKPYKYYNNNSSKCYIRSPACNWNVTNKQFVVVKDDYRFSALLNESAILKCIYNKNGCILPPYPTIVSYICKGSSDNLTVENLYSLVMSNNTDIISWVPDVDQLEFESDSNSNYSHPDGYSDSNSDEVVSNVESNNSFESVSGLESWYAARSSNYSWYTATTSNTVSDIYVSSSNNSSEPDLPLHVPHANQGFTFTLVYTPDGNDLVWYMIDSPAINPVTHVPYQNGIASLTNRRLRGLLTNVPNRPNDGNIWSYDWSRQEWVNRFTVYRILDYGMPTTINWSQINTFDVNMIERALGWLDYEWRCLHKKAYCRFWNFDSTVEHYPYIFLNLTQGDMDLRRLSYNATNRGYIAYGRELLNRYSDLLIRINTLNLPIHQYIIYYGPHNYFVPFRDLIRPMRGIIDGYITENGNGPNSSYIWAEDNECNYLMFDNR